MADAAATGRLDTGNLAEIFHVALRKAVDGTASVASWNMLHFMSDKVRVSFYGHLSKALADVPFDAAALRSAALAWQDSYADTEGYGEVCALSAVLKLHPAEDWVSISQFFRQCGAAPELDWDEDARSLWVGGCDFDAKLAVRDGDGLEFAAATRQSVRREGKSVPAWRVNVLGFDPFDVEGRIETLPDVVTRIHDLVAGARLAKLDERTRPEAVAALEGIDLAPRLDPADGADARFLAMAGEGVDAMFRWPARVGDVDSVLYIYRREDAGQPSGHFFGFARVWAEGGPADRMGRYPILSKWVGDHEEALAHQSKFGTDDDMVKATVRFEMAAGSHLTVTAKLEKVASDSRVLAERTLAFPDIAFRANYADAAPSR